MKKTANMTSLTGLPEQIHELEEIRAIRIAAAARATELSVNIRQLEARFAEGLGALVRDCERQLGLKLPPGLDPDCVLNYLARAVSATASNETIRSIFRTYPGSRS
ncbi:MAG: hypothetical protein M0R22_12630 [Dehalococcoidia bacterium]|jgi:hypothetical protein|nr:hypothetical protein [Dehalococcoidia bacterium]